ncbi:hypothetical protein KKB83_03630 [Patescibacteria group bacterium]|nr:hypothetical protein [Patescibacteria group bacterium]
MTLFQQTLILFAVIQTFFGYYEYKNEPDMLVIAAKLFQPKYLVSTVSICACYYLLVRFVIPFLSIFWGWFSDV